MIQQHTGVMATRILLPDALKTTATILITEGSVSMKNLTEQVSPIELQKGDRVEAYGALMEVMHIVESGCDVPGGVRVAAIDRPAPQRRKSSAKHHLRPWFSASSGYQDSR